MYNAIFPIDLKDSIFSLVQDSVQEGIGLVVLFL